MRRATVGALGPLVAGAVTTTDVLDRVLTAEDVERLEALAKELSRRGSEEVQAGLKPLLRLSSRAKGKTPAQILRITL